MTAPRATYRLQLSPAFDFAAASEVVDYLAELGVSHLYASPILTPRPGSNHGYDVVDPQAVNPELGGEGGLVQLATALQARGMGLLLDIVPNHMAFAKENAMLVDVLEKGRDSEYASVFDINWDHHYDSLRGRVLAPFLGQFYGACLAAGELRLAFDEQGLCLRYYDQRYPLALRSYDRVLSAELGELERRLGPDHADLIKFYGVRHLLQTTATIADRAVRAAQTAHGKRMLWDLYAGSPVIRAHVDASVEGFNRADEAARDQLDQLISEQHYRLSFWKVAAEEINYRRFFTINELICVRVEDPAVAALTHRKLDELVDRGLVDGLRIDHIDGLYHPRRYLEWLRRRHPETYLVVEKILEPGERLPRWPIAGTTGYEFIAATLALYCNRRSRDAFTRIYYRFTLEPRQFEETLADKRRLIIGKHLAGNIDNLAHELKRLAGEARLGRDITLYGLKRALVEVLAFVSVYRTYVDEESFSEDDARYLRHAVNAARQAAPGLVYELDFLEQFLIELPRTAADPAFRVQLQCFLMDVQQVTGPLMAKGCEDTTFYVYNRLIALNEVGCHPGRFGARVGEFHGFAKERAERWPAALNCSATHDTKRGEDVRARLLVLSELPREWLRLLRDLVRLNRARKQMHHGKLRPDANDEYYLYQVLLGTFPMSGEVSDEYVARLAEHAVKAVREAKVHTAWVKPDTEYEHACTAFVEALLRGPHAERFLERFLPFWRKVSFYGWLNSLSQTALKLTVPGVPDLYQGTELWDLSLVDPDNRRPVDFARRRRLLEELRADLPSPALCARLLATPESGQVKLYLLHRGLQCRREHAELFAAGSYAPLRIEEGERKSLVGFTRQGGGRTLLVVVPKLLTRVVGVGQLPIGPVWGETRLVLPDGAPTRWVNLFTGEQHEADGGALRAGVALAHFPAAVLLA